MKLTHTIGITAPAAVVWSVWSDVTRWPEWTASVTQVTLLGDGEHEPGRSSGPTPVAVGTRARIRQPKLPAAVWQVTSVDPGRAFTWVSRSPGSRVVGTHVVDPRGDEACSATMSITFEGPVGSILGRLWKRLSEQYMAVEAAGLAARSIAQPGGAAATVRHD